MATCPGIAQANVLPRRQGQSSQTCLNETLPSAASASAKSELQQKKREEEEDGENVLASPARGQLLLQVDR